MNILDGTDTRVEIRLGLTPEEFADLCDTLRKGWQQGQESTAGKILRLAEAIELGRSMAGGSEA